MSPPPRGLIGRKGEREEGEVMWHLLWVFVELCTYLKVPDTGRHFYKLLNLQRVSFGFLVRPNPLHFPRPKWPSFYSYQDESNRYA